MKTNSFTPLMENLFDDNPVNESSIFTFKCFDLLGVLIVAINTNGRMMMVNEAGKAMLGLHEKEIKERQFIQLVPDSKEREKLSELLDQIFRGEIAESEYEFVPFGYQAEEQRIFKIKFVPVQNRNNKTIGILASAVDVTSEKQSNRRLTRSKTEAEELNRAKSEFLARVTHEIRTPLNAIMGFTEQLKQTDLDEQQQEFLNIIDKSSEHLMSLINDVLILSKIEASELSIDRSPFKISYTLNYVHETLNTRAQNKNLQFLVDIDDRLDTIFIGDPFRLRQILINMVGNAIKFTHHGHVKLTCFLQAETDDKVLVQFTVEDTGIGIEAESLDIIFEQFRQADSSIAKKYGGTGLGLTICKNLIQMLNGTLSVTSTPSSGTTFSFTLPFLKGNESDLEPEEIDKIDSVKLQGKNILLVDDDSVNRLLGRTILEKFGCHFDIVISGKETIRKTDTTEYDVVLLDIHLPDINGIEVAHTIRQKKKNSSCKIIAVTAAVIQNDVQRFYEAGIDDFLIKPFKEINLFNKICQVLKINTAGQGRQITEIIIKDSNDGKIFDLTELRQMAGDDHEFANQMLITFIDNSENFCLLLQQHQEEKNWEQIGELTHKIIPSYRHLRMDSVVSQLLELKTKIQEEKDYNAVPALINSIIDTIKKLISELRKELTVN